MREKTQHEIDEDISIHIFNAAATLVGVSLPAIGVFKLIERARALRTIADELISLSALIFVFCCVFAYSALKTRRTKRKYLEEKIAEILFFTGLILMAVVCVLLAIAVA